MVSIIADLYSFSPNGLYLAYLIQSEKRILVRNCAPTSSKNESVATKQTDLQSVVKVGQKFSLPSTSCPVDNITWSLDSQFIGAICKKYAIVNIFNVNDSSWRCKLSLGTVDRKGGVGLENCWWSRDARHLLCLTQSSTYLAIYSIQENFVRYLKNVAKFPSSSPRHSFSSDGSLVAVAHVDEECKSFISVYCAKTWEKTKSFNLNRCKDSAGLSWGASEYLLVWDSSLFSNLCIYNVATCSLVKQYSPHGMTCGFETVQWSGCGTFILGTVMNKNEVHVLNGLTFGTLIHDVLEPSNGDTSGLEGDCQLFYDVGDRGRGVGEFLQVNQWPLHVMEHMNSCRSKIHGSKWGRTTHLKLHENGSLMACRTHLYPHIVWIYDLFKAAAISILIYKQPVLDFDWHPTYAELAIISSPVFRSESIKISLWTLGKGVHIYPSHRLRKMLTDCSSLKWSPLGNILLLQNDKYGMVHLFPIKQA